MKAWWAGKRFTTAQGLPLTEGTRGSLVAFVSWMLREGQQNGKGLAASSASTILAGFVVGLRGRGCTVSRDDQAAARKALDGLTVRLLQQGERRGRGQAAAAEVPSLVVHACPDTLAGARDKALILTGFHYASRAQDPAGLLLGDVALTPRGLVVSVLTGKTKHSVRDAKINYQDDRARSLAGTFTACGIPVGQRSFREVWQGTVCGQLSSMRRRSSVSHFSVSRGWV